MKKTALALSLSTLFAVPAFAQSSVTLYGIIDEGLNYTSNVENTAAPLHGQSLWSMNSGLIQGSRWGVKGSEDLGGGLHAIFDLENGFDVNNGTLGQGGREFGRQAYVGLTGDTWGSLTMGRQYDTVVDYIGPLTANGGWAGTVFAHPFDNDNTNNSLRINNSVKYATPIYSGFQASGLYGFSNSSGNAASSFANNRAESLGAKYSNGPITAAVAYLNIDNPASATSTSGAVTDTMIGNVSSANRYRVFAAGGKYNFGPAAVGLVYTHTAIDDIAAVIGTDKKYDNIELNATYNLTPALMVGGMYTYTALKNTSAAAAETKNKYNQFGLIADYSLSKRTDVYAQAVYQKVSGDGAGTTVFADNRAAAGASATTSQTVARIGLRHKF